jgi:carbamate kinase
MKDKPIVLVAFGGNALIQKGQEGTATEQFVNLQKPMSQLARLSEKYKIVITHGNGPQVGNLLLQQESCDAVPKMPLEIIGAMTQGQIGYMIEVVVDKNDAAFQNPTKPIGPFYTEKEAKGLPYNMAKTDKGHRRVVASPQPLTIVEGREIKRLIEMDFIVICCGGGGIPVIRKERKFRGVEAVIDKDLASSVLAQEIRADIFVIASDVEGAGINWGQPEQKILRKVPLSEMESHVQDGQFPSGSMGPKVEAITRFFKTTGKRAVICNLADIEKAIDGKAGTEIV